MHCSGAWGPLLKQNTWTLQLLLRALWKRSTYTLHLLLGPFESKYLQIGVDIGGLFESVVLAHYSCYWGPLWKQSNYTIQLLIGASLKAEYIIMMCTRNYYMSGQYVFHQKGGKITRETPRGVPEASASLTSSFKHTTAPDTPEFHIFCPRQRPFVLHLCRVSWTRCCLEFGMMLWAQN